MGTKGNCPARRYFALARRQPSYIIRLVSPVSVPAFAFCFCTHYLLSSLVLFSLSPHPVTTRLSFLTLCIFQFASCGYIIFFPKHIFDSFFRVSFATVSHYSPNARFAIMFHSFERLFSLSVVLGAITSFAAAQNCSQLHMVCSSNAISLFV